MPLRLEHVHKGMKPIEMVVFMIILFVGFVYVWKKGALEWD